MKKTRWGDNKAKPHTTQMIPGAVVPGMLGMPGMMGIPGMMGAMAAPVCDLTVSAGLL